MNNLMPVWRILSRYKYAIVIVAGVVVVGFLDENSMLKRIEYDYQIKELEGQIAGYKARYESDSRQLRELRENPKAVEKIARERYFMKRADEDVFILSDDNVSVGGEDDGKAE